MSVLTVVETRRELARRVSGGIEVTLYWSADDNGTSIEVWQPATGELLLFPVERTRALDAFYHPFAHLPPRRTVSRRRHAHGRRQRGG